MTILEDWGHSLEITCGIERVSEALFCSCWRNRFGFIGFGIGTFHFRDVPHEISYNDLIVD